jgi:hypothetical protein
VLGDEAQPAAGSRDAAPTGPRHDAPRKSLLTKLHVPAGKAVALAAMPTAVLMGMGFTPHFAQADEMPKSSSPFKPGPCVTQPDSKDAAGSGSKDGAKATPTPTASPSATGKDAAGGKDAGGSGKDAAGGKDAGGSGKDGAQPTPTTSPSASAPSVTDPVAKALPKTQQATPKASPSASPSASPTPSPSASTNPLDPLGLGNLLGGLLGGLTGNGGGSTPTPAPTTQSPTPAPTTSAPKPDPTPTGSTGSGSTSGKAPSTGSSGSSGSAGKDGGSGKDATKGLTDTVGTTVKGLTDAAGKATGTTPSDASGKAAQTPTDGSQGYPCPTYDAKALADAPVEDGIPKLADESWTLKSSKLTLDGLNYEGIVRVRTMSGTKDVLKFTATGVDIDDLWQIINQPQGGHTWVKARAGSTSTIRGGTVTMYTESLSGNLLGLIPITFTPKAPPPLTLPKLFFTDVTVIQAAQFGGNLTVPGMQVLPGQP